MRIAIELERLPLAPGVADPQLAATAGDDYELLFTAPAGVEVPAGIEVTWIGDVAEGDGVALTLEGRPLQLSGLWHRFPIEGAAAGS